LGRPGAAIAWRWAVGRVRPIADAGYHDAAIRDALARGIVLTIDRVNGTLMPRLTNAEAK